VNKTSTNDNSLYVTIRYFIPSCRYYFENELSEDPSSCYNEGIFTKRTDAVETDFERNFDVIRDVPIQITYQSGENPEVSIEVIPNETNFEYEIDY
jgi:hypothetical protein